jgi:hypothetical protein
MLFEVHADITNDDGAFAEMQGLGAIVQGQFFNPDADWFVKESRLLKKSVKIWPW